MKNIRRIKGKDFFSKEVQFLYQKMNNISKKDILNNYKESIWDLFSAFFFELSVKTEYYLYYSEEDEEDVELYHFLKNINNSSFIEEDGEKLYLLKKENYEDYLSIVTKTWESFFEGFEELEYQNLFSYYLPKKNTFLFDEGLPNDSFYQNKLNLFKDDYYIFLSELNINNFIEIKNIYIESLKEIFKREGNVYLFKTHYNLKDKKESVEDNNNSDIFLVFGQENLLIKRIVEYLSNLFLIEVISIKKRFDRGSEKYLYCYPISLVANDKNKKIFLRSCFEIKDIFSEEDKDCFPEELFDFYQKNKIF